MGLRLTLFFTLLGLGNVFAQEIPGYFIGKEQGLSIFEANFFAEDNTGHLWVAGKSGVHRFNGVNWDSFGTADGINNQFITQLCTDECGEVYIMDLSQTVFKFNGIGFDSICRPTIKKDAPLEMRIDSNAIVWSYKSSPHFVKFLRNEGEWITEARPFKPLQLKVYGGLELEKSEDIYRLGDEYSIGMGRRELFSDWHVLDLDSNQWVLHYKDSVFWMQEDSVIRRWNLSSYLYALVPTAKGIVSTNPLYNTAHLFSVQDGAMDSINLGQEIISSGIFQDSEGQWWMGEARGLRVIPFPNYSHYPFPESYLLRHFLWFSTTDFVAEGPYLSIVGSIGNGRIQWEIIDEERKYIHRDTVDGGIYYLDENRNWHHWYALNEDSTLKGLPPDYLNRNFLGQPFYLEGQYIIRGNKITNIDSIDVPCNTTRAIQKDSNTLFVSCWDGLYLLDKDLNFSRVLHPHKALKDMIINAIRWGEQIIFLSRSSGLISYREGRFEVLDEKQGFPTEKVTDLFVDKTGLWTTSGFEVIYIEPNPENFKASRIVTIPTHTIYANGDFSSINIEGDSVFFLYSNAMIAIAKEELIRPPKIKPSLFQWVEVNGVEIPLDSVNRSWKHNQNQWAIGFSRASFKDQSGLKYHYRLKEKGFNSSDSPWILAKDPRVQLLNLSPGDYVFEVRSIVQNDASSIHTAALEFNILPPFYQTWWFRLLVVVSIILSIYYYFRTRFRILRKELHLKRQLDRIKQQMIGSQMNPHFLFNSLTSIQRYMLENNLDDAERYLTKFAKLIRTVFENSQSELIPLDKELKALRRYLELEEQRLRGKLTYSFELETSMHSKIHVPPLLLQPFVENAVIHGIQLLKSEGWIKIRTFRSGTDFCILIEDNGIGIEASKKMKSETNPEHHSKGMQLTKERVQLMRDLYRIPITLKITDKLTFGKHLRGTHVLLTFHLKTKP